MDFIKRRGVYLVLFFVVVLGYWQVSFLVYPMKWDLIDVIFPFRFYFSECIRSGYFPFWNPFQQTGTPFFADLQAPTYYPEMLFVSFLGGYSVKVMNILFTAYLFIAALGMYRLSFYFNQNKLASLMAGIAYALSGYIVGHGQHLFLLIGSAWIPFVLKNYLKLLQGANFILVMKTALFLFLMVTGGYQALSIGLFYLMALLFAFYLTKEAVQKNRTAIFSMIKANLLLFFLVVVLLLPLIVSTSGVIDDVSRFSHGVDPEFILVFGQSLKALISFLLPFSTLKYESLGSVDTSMINHYFGLIPLLFFGLSITRKRTAAEYLILGFGLVIFASSFQAMQVREFLFRFVPMMNLFKHAAFIRVFGLLAFILLAANYFSWFQQNFEKEKKKVLLLGSLLGAALLFIIVYSFGNTSLDEIREVLRSNPWEDLLKAMPFYQHVLFHAVLQLIIVGLFLAIIINHKKIKFPFRLIFVLFVIEMVVSVQLNIAVSVADTNLKPSRMDKDLALFPERFPIPVNNKIIYNDNQHVIFSPFWRNTYIFSKQVSFDAFSSFRLDSYNKLYDHYPNLRKAVLNNHLFYFSDSIFPISKFDDSEIDPQSASKWLFVDDKDYESLSGQKTQADPADRIVIKAFSPNKVVAETETRHDQFLTMIQTHFKGWEAFIDDQATPIYTSNHNYRTIFLPKGKHVVSFEYKNNTVLILYILSNLLFLLIALLLLGALLREKKGFGKMYIWIPAVILLLAAAFTLKQLTYRDKNKTVSEIYEERWKEQQAIFYDQKISSEEPAEVKAEDVFFNIADIDHMELGRKSGTLVVSAKVFPESYVDVLIVSDVSKQGKPETWHASKVERHIEKLDHWNKVIYFRNFYDLKNEDVINVYLWNLHNHDFKIKDIVVRFYP